MIKKQNDLIHAQTNLSKAILGAQARSTLPSRNITPFGGDPLEYGRFLKSFEFGVEAKTDSYRERLYYLEQYTTGEVQQLVRSFFSVQPSQQAYLDAWGAIMNRYGNRHKMAEAFMKKAEKYPIYGDINARPNDTMKKGSRPFKSGPRVLASSTKEGGDDKCVYCSKDNHTIAQCRQLRGKPVVERLDFIRKQNYCFGCLKRAAHRRTDCRCKLKCDVCQRRHPTVLHDDDYKPVSYPSKSPSATTQSKDSSNTTDATSGVIGAGSNRPAQTVVSVIVRSKTTGITVKTNALLDEGSDAVFCTEELMNKLRTEGHKTQLRVQTLTGESLIPSHKLVNLEVMDCHGDNTIKLPQVYTCAKLPASQSHAPTKEDLKAYPHLHGVPLPEFKGDVEILIGNNVPEALEPWEIIHSENQGPFASRTLLGWVVHGLAKVHDGQSSIPVYRTMVDDETTRCLRDLYNHDFPERIIEDVANPSLEDERFMQYVTGSVCKDDGHYQIGLPLKNQEVQLPSNRPLVEQRLKHLKGKLAKNKEFRGDYQNFMKETVRNGYAERVPDEELQRDDGRLWYIPHHGVLPSAEKEDTSGIRLCGKLQRCFPKPGAITGAGSNKLAVWSHAAFPPRKDCLDG